MCRDVGVMFGLPIESIFNHAFEDFYIYSHMNDDTAIGQHDMDVG